MDDLPIGSPQLERTVSIMDMSAMDDEVFNKPTDLYNGEDLEAEEAVRSDHTEFIKYVQQHAGTSLYEAYVGTDLVASNVPANTGRVQEPGVDESKVLASIGINRDLMDKLMRISVAKTFNDRLHPNVLAPAFFGEQRRLSWGQRCQDFIRGYVGVNETLTADKIQAMMLALTPTEDRPAWTIDFKGLKEDEFEHRESQEILKGGPATMYKIGELYGVWKDIQPHEVHRIFDKIIHDAFTESLSGLAIDDSEEKRPKRQREDESESA